MALCRFILVYLATSLAKTGDKIETGLEACDKVGVDIKIPLSLIGATH